MPALIVLVVIGVIVALWVSWYLKEQRRKEMAAVAARLGLQFSITDPFNLDDMGFSLFGRGEGQGAENVMWGSSQNRRIMLFDFWYYETTTDSEGHASKTYHHFSCATLEIDAGCPHLRVVSEDFFSRLADHVGFRDIEFESGEFNKRFQVTSADRKFAFALIDARMMEWLMANGRWSFEVMGGVVLCYTSRMKPAELPILLHAGRGFCDHVPDVVKSLYPMDAGSGR